MWFDITETESRMNATERLREFVACAWGLGTTPADRYDLLWRQTKNLRARVRLARHHPDHIFQVRTRYGLIHLRDNFGDVTNLPGLLHQNEYRIGKFSGGGVVLDVGANIGLVAALVAWHNPATPIHCFEPLPGNVKMIGLNCPSARIEHACVGRAPATIRLRVDRDGVMATSIATAWETSECEFPVITLEGYVAAHGIRAVEFLKIDTEGMEIEVLEGARTVLPMTARVAMETHSADLHRESLARLRAAGLTIEEEDFDGATGFVFAAR